MRRKSLYLVSTLWGRVIGAVVIPVSVMFVSFVTATVTTLFVSAEREEEDARQRELRRASEEEKRALLRQFDQRLAAIDAKLDA